MAQGKRLTRKQRLTRTISVAVAVVVASVGLGVGIPLIMRDRQMTASLPAANVSLVPVSPAPSGAVPTSASPSSSTSSSVSQSAEPTDSDMPVIEPEGQAPRPDSADDGVVKALVNVKTKDPVIFITIDDGMYQDPEALKLVQEEGIPITAFLTEWTTYKDKGQWFEDITAYGGSIQNHTKTHKNLNDPKTNLHHEICGTQAFYTEKFGTTPWMLRPPYGEGYDNDKVQEVAASCGISKIVLWNVQVAEGGKSVEYWDAPLRAGDIVLAHFDKDLHLDLEKILELAKAQGLTPASLADYI